ncbi:MAG: hypothetical protein CL942_00020 [Desulfovibrio sp.]|nr:hypothetical protein [Desulfovibrio sp.]
MSVLWSDPNKSITREFDIFISGHPYPVNVSVAPIKTDEGDTIGNVLILSNLTEIHKLQAEIRQREKMAAVGNLAAGVAHEVRNPLSSIKGYATFFAGLFDKESEEHKAASVMISETERLNRVISELLELSRPSDFNFQPIEVSVVLDTIARLIQQDVKSNNIQLEIDLPQDTSSFNMDGDRMVQALLNICLNGIQAMDNAGKLAIAADASNTALTLSVSDTGTGIPQENLEAVFDPYFTTKSKGTGLGLAVVRKIIDGHGGTIEIQSEEGKGATFVITIPDIKGKGN